MMLIICHHPTRHITAGLFGLQRVIDYFHKIVVSFLISISTFIIVHVLYKLFNYNYLIRLSLVRFVLIKHNDSHLLDKLAENWVI